MNQDRYRSSLANMLLVILAIFGCTRQAPIPLKAEYSIETLKESYYYIGEINNPLHFSNSSTSANSYEWDFDDGTTSSYKNPTHTFAKSGTYEVVLTVSDGKTTKTSSSFVKIGHRLLDGLLLEKINFSNPIGESWDSGSGPDIVVVIIDEDEQNGASLILSTSDNISSIQIPYGGDFILGGGISFKSSKFSISLFDNDDPMAYLDSNDDLMFQANFDPYGVTWAKKTSKGNFVISTGVNGNNEATDAFAIRCYWKFIYVD